MKKKNTKKRVAVAMSGGVDSSVAAWLLQRQGYDVIGVMGKFWGDAAFRESGFTDSCCSLEARKKGEAIAHRLGIPFYFIDLEMDFKAHVVDEFIEKYAKGATPNPCVTCNREVKIGLLLKKVQELFGVNYLATGHYATIDDKKDPLIHLSGDATKDQTYFLARVRREDLKHLLFPCGEYTKDEIRGLARKAGLADLVLQESMELCFFSEKTPKNFLQKNIGKLSGQITDPTGKVLGTHEGTYLYTLGQRKGMNLGVENATYVKKIDPRSRTIEVSYSHDDPELTHTQVLVKNMNRQTTRRLPKHVQVKLRHSPRFVGATTEEKKNTVILYLDEPVRAVSRGQLAALYANGTLLGGGEIAKAQ